MTPEDLDDHTPIEPDDARLASVHARSRSFRRRRSTQRITSVMAGVVVLALAGGIAWTRADTTSTAKITLGFPTTTTTTSTAAPALTQDEILGKWRPVTITGYDGTPIGSMSFDGRGGWTGTDGCNSYSNGTYRLDGNEVRLGPATVTQGFCAMSRTTTPVNPNFDPIVSAPRIELRDDQLTFLTSEGTEIARFVRAGATARIELPETTMTAGSKMTGHVIVENNTGNVIEAGGCGSLFQIQLGNDAIHPDPIWTRCLQPLPIPVGESSYAVQFYASYNSCSTPAQSNLQACIPNVGPPPLPPGNYQAQFFQSSRVVTPALPIDVNVVP